MPPPEATRKAGKFRISPEKEIYGELTYAGPSTRLYIRDEASFNIVGINGGYVFGELHDLIKVSLLECRCPMFPNRCFAEGKVLYYSADIFPHFVVEGSRHLLPDEESITHVHLLLDDAEAVFYDFDAFGSTTVSAEVMNEIIKSHPRKSEIKIGPLPLVQYFTGNTEIVSVATELGKISASHNPTFSSGGISGTYIRNSLYLTVEANAPVTFGTAISDALKVIRFLSLLAGRPQNLVEMRITLKLDGAQAHLLRVYWSMPPERKSEGGEKPGPGDVLVQWVTQPDEFTKVASGWFARQEERNDSRLRFDYSFSKQGNYEIDRLIASANMFDILPASAVAPEIEIADDLRSAVKQARDLFRNLPDTPERASILGALGRVGKNTLKQKIRYRAQKITDYAGHRFPDLLLVTDEAVNCRNHYVHGGDSKFDYNTNSHMVVFFTNALEFVFGASELTEAGWDIKMWCERLSALIHPFDSFRFNYANDLRALKLLLGNDANA